MKRIITSILLTLFASSAFATFDGSKDPLTANWITGTLTGVYVVPNDRTLVRLAYDGQTMRFQIGDTAPLKDLQVDSFSLLDNTVNVTYLWKGSMEMGTFKKYSDGLVFTMHDGSQIPMESLRIMSKMDVKKLFCLTAKTDTVPRGDRGFQCQNMATDQ